ncbi:hypothetical protein DPMN_133950 [Dreissena polymorpha]|uniref:Uncharacterized protein n=1 Tax=Dreissena polymorpha TaxID=45954 RepID=A0A9D4FV97_DREPO|nr:hypothetical protein DPMN_133950 [Dreissena polymorpha]
METMASKILIICVLLPSVFDAKSIDIMDDRMQQFETLLQNMSKQLEKEHLARIEIEKKLANAGKIFVVFDL